MQQSSDSVALEIVHKMAGPTGLYRWLTDSLGICTVHGIAGQTIVVCEVAQPNGVGLLQLYDGSEYWGEWRAGQRHGWGLWRMLDGECEYRGEFYGGVYCGLGVLHEGSVLKQGRWVNGTLALQQRLPPSALFASRDAAIRAGSAAACCFPDEARANAEAIICRVLAETERHCAALERSRKQPAFKSAPGDRPEATDEDLRLLRNTGDEPEFEFFGGSVTITLLDEDTHKLRKQTLPHAWGRMRSIVFGWIYRGQFDSGMLHGLGGVVWNRLEIVKGELRHVAESYIGNWREGRREGCGAFMRSDGTSEQGVWCNNNLVEEHAIDIKQLMVFQAAVNQGEAIAMEAEARIASPGCGSLKKKTKAPGQIANVDDVDTDVDPYSSEYITKLMALLLQNAQSREAAQNDKNRRHDAECQRVEQVRQQEAAAFAAHAAALAGDSDSGDDGAPFCTLGTAFFTGRLYFGDSPVNVGIEFDKNSKPSRVKEFCPSFNGQPHGFGCLWQQIGTKSDRETSFHQGEFKNGMAHGWGEKKSTAGTYRGQFEKDERHGFGEWTFPDGSVSVSFWHFDSVVKQAFMPPQMRSEMCDAIHKAQVSAVAAGCLEDFDVHRDEVVEWRRLRESRVTEAKRKCAVELAIATNKYFTGDVGFSSLPRGTPFHEHKSFEDLKRLDRENTQLDINNLEKYLNEEEFEEAFGISSFAFRLLKPQDQKALKARAGLLPEKHVAKRSEEDSSNQKGKQIYRAVMFKKSQLAKR